MQSRLVVSHTDSPQPRAIVSLSRSEFSPPHFSFTQEAVAHAAVIAPVYVDGFERGGETPADSRHRSKLPKFQEFTQFGYLANHNPAGKASEGIVSKNRGRPPTHARDR